MRSNIIIARRKLLVSSIAVAISCSIPIRAMAAIEPLTMLEATAAVVGILRGVAGSGTDARKEAKKMTKLLAVVIANQERILAELRDLKLYIDEALLRSWRDAYARSIESYNAQLEIYVNDVAAANWRVTKRLREDFSNLSRNCLNVTMSIGTMDPWAFHSFATGVSVVLIAELLLESNSTRIQSTKHQFGSCLDGWLDEEKPRAMPAFISQLQSEIDQKTRLLNSKRRSYVIATNRTITVDRKCSDFFMDTLNITGDIDSGFVGKVTSYKTRRECEGNDPPGGRMIPTDFRSMLGGPVFNPGAQSIALAASSVEPDVSIPQVPLFVASGLPYVDEFNRERTAIWELRVRKAQLEQLKVEMRRMRELLS